jgi:hypothetical protein
MIGRSRGQLTLVFNYGQDAIKGSSLSSKPEFSQRTMLLTVLASLLIDKTADGDIL